MRLDMTALLEYLILCELEKCKLMYYSAKTKGYSTLYIVYNTYFLRIPPLQTAVHRELNSR